MQSRDVLGVRGALERRFNRSRLLLAAGGGLLAVATDLAVATTPAYADHYAWPYPCYAYGECHSCSGTTCTQVNCTYNHWEGCPSSGQCWNSLVPVGGGCYDSYTCCDWAVIYGGQDHGHCICRGAPQRIC